MSGVTRFSLLGLGRAGGFHLESLRLLESVGAVLQCVYDVDRDRASDVASKNGCRVPTGNGTTACSTAKRISIS